MPSRTFCNPCKPCLYLVSMALLGITACGDKPPPATTSLPAVEYDAALRSRISVSGVSSGGYMAVQSHVAFAEKIGGIAVVAGGPYHCAAGDVKTALGSCMTGADLGAEPMIDFVNEAAAAGSIATPDTMQDARVWIFHSPADAVVSPRAGDALADFYAAFVPTENIGVVNDIESAHGWPTVAAGVACEEQGGHYINACDYDAAGELLQHLYRELQPAADDAVTDNLGTIDLSRYFDADSHIADAGFAYAPSACRATADDCRLHVALHGCVQGAEFLEDRFVRQAGFNEWAETNRIVVVYPQLESSLFNPKGCWDWWGYTGDDYDLRSGKQVAGISAIIDAFVSGTLLPGQTVP
ncbi:MAG: extracellular catalytic domain type 2 short-chain-length polyhydroxyalkanoate depolymerase [Woeseiaceae bacterium]